MAINFYPPHWRWFREKAQETAGILETSTKEAMATLALVYGFHSLDEAKRLIRGEGYLGDLPDERLSKTEQIERMDRQADCLAQAWPTFPLFHIREVVRALAPSARNRLSPRYLNRWVYQDGILKGFEGYWEYDESLFEVAFATCVYEDAEDRLPFVLEEKDLEGLVAEEDALDVLETGDCMTYRQPSSLLAEFPGFALAARNWFYITLERSLFPRREAAKFKMPRLTIEHLESLLPPEWADARDKTFNYGILSNRYWLGAWTSIALLAEGWSNEKLAARAVAGLKQFDPDNSMEWRELGISADALRSAVRALNAKVRTRKTPDFWVRQEDVEATPKRWRPRYIAEMGISEIPDWASNTASSEMPSPGR